MTWNFAVDLNIDPLILIYGTSADPGCECLTDVVHVEVSA
jgi:hypothetical protein